MKCDNRMELVYIWNIIRLHMNYSNICVLLTAFIFIQHSGYTQEVPAGTEFYEMVREMEFAEREQLIYEQFQSGNFPDFLIDYRELTTQQTDAAGKMRTLTLFVSPQYLTIGNEKDHFIIPVGPATAQKIALEHNAFLPTPKIVDMIYESADLKLEPFTYIPRGNRNETPDIQYEHSKVIQAQIKAAGLPSNTFVAGHKKDIVISPLLGDKRRQNHVTIYGWHLLDGKPIQPVTNIHNNTYVDYSHGARLISRRVVIDDKEYDYEEVLKDKILYPLLIDSQEPLKTTRY